VTVEQFPILALTFGVLSNVPRMRIIRCLARSNTALTTQEISLASGVNDRLVSAHLQILRDRDFVQSTRSGKNVLWILVDWKRDEMVRVISELFSKE
jgi:DNA-binding transcriptional ArsR family regulator